MSYRILNFKTNMKYFSDQLQPVIIKVIIIFLFCFHGTNSWAQCCTYTLFLNDSYGDDWNGATLEVLVNKHSIGIFSASHFGSIDTFQVCNGDSLDLIYTSGIYEEDNTYRLQDPSWNIVFKDGPYPDTGHVYSGIADCDKPLLPGAYPCTAIAIDTGQCVLTDNTGFPGSGLIPNCSQFKGGDIWFKMQVPSSGNLSFETKSGSINDTGIAVWKSRTCDTLTITGCDDDAGDGYLSFLPVYDLTPGQIIYIQLWGYGGAAGTFEICVKDLGNVIFESSELPVIIINTLGQKIIDEPKINCLMDIKYNGPGKITHVSDDANIYSGYIGIEIRGATSSGYPQKPYGIETRTPDGENNDVSLLGMPKENDWVLLSNYNDRSLMRNLLAYHLFSAMGNYSTRAHLCEVMIDSSYKGIYVFGEKIKRDKNRVDIAKLEPFDTLGDELTGGYILEQNYWDDQNSFKSNYSPIDHPGFDVHFLYEYPDKLEIQPAQKKYIASYVDSLETALYSSDFSDASKGYRKYMDVKSFIDYFLVNEVSRNADGFKKSVFYNKDKNSKGGKLKAGPVWDFDWAWKNLENCSIYNNFDGSGWAHHNNDCSTDNYATGWYIRMFQDSTFSDELRCTYEDYRQNILDTATIFAFIDSLGSLVQNAQARHFKKWPLLGRSGDAPEIGLMPISYYDELDTLKNWIGKRLHWLDLNIPGLCASSGVIEKNTSVILNCYPNPAKDYFTVDFSLSAPQNVNICLYNLLGDKVFAKKIDKQDSANQIIDIETKDLSPGIYLLEFRTISLTTIKKLVIVK